MGSKCSKNHVNGDMLSGRHTTLIDAADRVVKKAVDQSWFGSIRTGEIHRAVGGKTSVTIRRCTDKIHRDTLKLIFKQPGSVQKVFLYIPDLETHLSTAVSDITAIIKKRLRGADIYNRTEEIGLEETTDTAEKTVDSTAGAKLLEKWKR